jgi:DNA-binding beta-propeller fold protein YncE
VKKTPAQLLLIPFALVALEIAVGEAVPRAQGGAQSSASNPSRRVERVWPEPPASPRIKFITSLAPSTSNRRSFLRKLWNAVSGGSATPAMASPYGIAVASQGRVYVADSAGRALHAYDLRKGAYSKLDIDGESLIGVAALGGRLYVTDSVGGRVICVNGSGRKQWTLGAEAGFQRPTGIVADDDRLHVVDTLGHRVVTLSPDGRVLGSFGSRGAEPGQFNFPTNIARDAAGRLYVTDSMNFRLQILTREGRSISSFGQLGDGSGDFNRPKGVAVDAEGHIYIVEGLHDVVQIFDREGRFLLSFAGPGNAEGELWLATGIAIADDRIYVADSANHRVQVFEYLQETP